MSVVIVGGHDRMVAQYKKICKSYKCKVKVFTHMGADFNKQIGCPDLLVLFTNTVSHKMVRCALDEIDGKHTDVVRCHTSSGNAKKNREYPEVYVSIPIQPANVLSPRFSTCPEGPIFLHSRSFCIFFQESYEFKNGINKDTIRTARNIQLENRRFISCRIIRTTSYCPSSRKEKKPPSN